MSAIADLLQVVEVGIQPNHHYVTINTVLLLCKGNVSMTINMFFFFFSISTSSNQSNVNLIV